MACLEYFAARCPNTKATLCEKEIEEINALRTVFPDAKLIIYLWHVLRAIEIRLGKDSTPGAYDPKEANEMFSFIDLS